MSALKDNQSNIFLILKRATELHIYSKTVLQYSMFEMT